MNFRYTIQDNSYGGSGDVVADLVTGFDGVELTLERHDKYHGFIDYMDNSLGDLRFYGNAYDVITTAYESNGVDADVNLLVEMQCQDSDAYEQVYLGKLNFMTYEKVCNATECYVRIACGAIGCVMELKNRMDTKVDLDSIQSFDGITMDAYTGLGVETTLPSVPIRRTSTWSIAPGTTWSYTDDLLRYYYFNQGDYYFSFDWNTVDLNECEVTNPLPTSLAYLDYPSWLFTFALLQSQYDGIWEYKVADATFDCSGSITINVDIDGEFTISTTGISAINYAGGIYLIYGSASSGYNSVTLHTLTGSGATTNSTETFTISDSQTFTMEQGDRVWLHIAMAQLYNSGGGSNEVIDPFTIDFTINSGTLEMIDNSTCVRTDTKSYLINEALSRTVESVTDSCLKVYSDYYGRTDSEPYNVNDADLGNPYNVNGCGSMRTLTNGLLIRGALLQDGTTPALKVSFEEIFDALNCIDNIGWGIEDHPGGGQIVRVEPYQHFYSDSVILNCPYVNEVVETMITGNVFNQAKVGYAKWETENTNGLLDIFGQRTYRTQISAAKNTYERLCKFIASDYAMEITRRLFGANTTDFRYDNDTFIICVEVNYGGYWAERFNFGQYGWGTDNILFPDYMYNVRITPTSNLLRHLNLINEQSTYDLQFVDGTGNFTAGFTTLGDSCIDLAEWQENMRVLPEVLDDAWALPIRKTQLATFEWPLSNAEWQTILASPYGTVTYSCADGVTQYGYIKSVSYSPVKGMATIKLIKKVV